MDAFTPQQTVELVARTGCKKAHMRIDKLFFNSFLAGCLLGFGCAVLLSTNASPWYQDNAPGLIRTIGALLFPVGLIMITLTGADLWTTNIMFMLVAWLSKRIRILDVGISMFVSFFGNLAGSLFLMGILFGYGDVFGESPQYKQAAIQLTTEKAITPEFHQIFLRGIGANWLVCMAVFLSIQSREVISKIFAIWFPTATFVALALDHVVANMFFIPMGIFMGAPLSVGTYIWKSMISTALGNLVGGGFFVGFMYWYLFLSGEEGVEIAFDIGGAASAVEGSAGPMRIEGRDPNLNTRTSSPRGMVSTNPGQLVSGVAKDLGDSSVYAKTHHERESEKSEAEWTEQA